MPVSSPTFGRSRMYLFSREVGSSIAIVIEKIKMPRAIAVSSSPRFTGEFPLSIASSALPFSLLLRFFSSIQPTYPASKLPNNSSFRLVFVRSSAAFLFLSLSPWSREGCDAARASPEDDHRATQSGLDFLTSTSIYINSSKARVVECGTVNEWRSKGTRTVPGPAAPTAAASPTWTSREL